MRFLSFIYKASPPTLADGEQTQPLVDNAGNLKTSATPAVAGAGTGATAERTIEASASIACRCGDG